MSGHAQPFTKGREIHRSHAVLNSVGQIQNVKAARVYVFGDGDMYEDDEGEKTEYEMPEIRSRRGQCSSGGVEKSFTEEKEFLEKEIGEGDTLLSLALKYACPVSELKRVNNLIKDQEFYALRVLKVPIRRYGYLSEAFAKEKQEKERKQKDTCRLKNVDTLLSDCDSPVDAICSDVDFSDPDTQLRVIRTVSIRENFSKQGHEARHFLQEMDKDLTKIRQSVPSDHDSLNEVISILSHQSIYPLTTQKKLVNGADCGIRWWVILIIALAVAILVPAMYFIYYKFMMAKSSSMNGHR